MANSDHLKIIKKGVEGWNKWRKENPDSKPDLGWANLIGLDLNDALFKDSNFKLAFCKECSLIEVDFSDSNLYGTNFENSILTNSNLENANLEGAHLVNADLTGVNLRG
ncbi:MAG: hypothetical protein GTO02_08170, partial [Candidatus Dadabacteria bacterium]|nr:hypothetical protein [Candidatus Dadabacteria bacterium]NIQ14365.1 hypothetical protein [Candidatus Dadabacteria bacterium]